MKMFRIALAAALVGGFFMSTLAPAPAQQGGGVVFIPPITPGDCAKWYAINTLEDSGGTCGGGGGSVSITSNGTLTVSPSPLTGTGTINLNLGNANTWTAAQTFTNSDILLLGSSTGATTFTSANASASNFTLTFPAATDTLADLAGTQTLSNKTLASPVITTAFTATGLVTNADLVNAATTVNGQTCTLGSTCTVTASATGITVGTTSVSGGTSPYILYNNGGTLGNIQTIPVANGGTNCNTASITCFNNITGYTASGATGTTSTNLVFSTSPTFAGTVTMPDLSTLTSTGLTGLVSLGVTNPTANTVPITESGYSLTGSNAQSLLSLSGTWNTTGTPTAILLNIIDTASNSASIALGIQRNSGYVWYTDKFGNTHPASMQQTSNTWALNSAGDLYLNTNAGFVTFGSANDVTIGRNATGVLQIGITSNNAAGSLALTGLTATGSSVNFSGLSSSSAATTGTVCWTTGTGNLTVDTTLACLASTRRIKDHIEPLQNGLAETMKLRPVSYDLKPKFNPKHLGRQVGLVAEEVEKIDPRLVGYGGDGKIEGVRYMQLTAVLVKAVQEQQAEIGALKAEVKRLEAR